MLELGSKLYLGVILLNPILKNIHNRVRMCDDGLTSLNTFYLLWKKIRYNNKCWSHHLQGFFFFNFFVISKIGCKEKGQQHHEMWLHSHPGSKTLNPFSEQKFLKCIKVCFSDLCFLFEVVSSLYYCAVVYETKCMSCLIWRSICSVEASNFVLCTTESFWFNL
jgi:hypothetical protein